MTTRSLKICAITTVIAASVMLSACESAEDKPVWSAPTTESYSQTDQDNRFIAQTRWAIAELDYRGFDNATLIFEPEGAKSTEDLAFYADVDLCRVKIIVKDANTLSLVKPDGETIDEPTLHKARSDAAFASCAKDPADPNSLEDESKVSEFTPGPPPSSSSSEGYWQGIDPGY